MNYSIIIPHKNCPKLLERCLSSIPVRNDIQVIIVDDNSDSKIVDFNNFPGKNRPNTEIYLTKEGKGAGYARNVGLKYAKGKWLLFADADDFYNKDAFSTLDSYIDSNYDIVHFLANSIDITTGEDSPREKKLERFYKRYKPNDIRSHDYIRFKSWEPWNKMIRYDFWAKYKIAFDEIPFGNDFNFSMKLSFLSRKYTIIQKKLYCLTYLPNSITFKFRAFETESLTFGLRAQMNTYFRKIGRGCSWHRYDAVLLLQELKWKGLKYGLGFIAYYIRNFNKISQMERDKEKEIKTFFKEHNLIKH